MNGTLPDGYHEDSSSNGNTTAKVVDWTRAAAKRTKMKKSTCKVFFFLWLNMQTCDFLVAAVVVIREFKIHDTTVAKTLLKIASSSSSIFLLIMLVCLTFES